jgi:2,4-dienoyl-CoA reductase-like NADH-dependent reductase (Old Yellow Enzyme family)
MPTPHHPLLFKPLALQGLRLKNRITMAPLYLGYAAEGGKLSPLVLHHYRAMARSGAALIVVENAAVAAAGVGSTRTLRCDQARFVPGLARLAETIKAENALAALQINHAGRFAGVPDPVAPAAVPAFGRTPRELNRREIRSIQKQFATAARRVREAGFDAVELHGGTGYLLAQFVSPRANTRGDAYGGALDHRMRFPLETLKCVQDAVGGFPVGYRFLADEWLPDGLRLSESTVFAQALSAEGVSYLSVMGGTYESFFLPEVVRRSKRPGYMVPLAAAVRRAVHVPVIAAGRIGSPEVAEDVIAQGKADLVGLARVLWADPLWLRKARKGRDRDIVRCSPRCNACMDLVMQRKPAFCTRWDREVREEYKALFA